jgi:hypothetical protein
MAFSLDVANNTINNMGYKGISDDENPHLNEGIGMLSSRPGDPLHEFDKDEMIRLCRLHEEEIGIMYPVLNIQSVISHAMGLATFLESIRQQNPREMINDDKTLQLKIIMCCALVVEEHGHSDKAIRLFESMETVLNRKLMAEAADVGTLPILALVAGYRFLSNDEVLAWRVMGHVARLCLELGIHQRTGLMRIQDEEERKNALVSFWSAYVLDRRWAFATGLPFVVQDEEIDMQLPFPVRTAPAPFATRIANKIAGRVPISRCHDYLFSDRCESVATGSSLWTSTCTRFTVRGVGECRPGIATVV